MTDTPAHGDLSQHVDWTAQVDTVAVVHLDREGNVTAFNPGAERIKGYAAADVVGTSFTRFYRTEDRMKGLPMQLLGIAAERGSVEDNGWRVRADGSLFWAHVVITALHDSEGAVIGFVKIVADGTGLKQEHDAELTFMRAFMHDFLSPLSAVRGYVDILEDTGAAPAEPLAHLSTATDHLMAMAERLSRRLRQAGDDSAPRVVDAVTAVHAAAELVLPGDAYGRVRITGAPHANVLVDPLSFRRALVNVIDNAAKYSDGVIDVDVDIAGDTVVISIADSGRGIDAADIERIFEPLERGRRSDPADGGIGMGLASTRALIESDGGSISIRSIPDVGSTVVIRVPGVGHLQATEPPEEARDAAGPSARGRAAGGDAPATAVSGPAAFRRRISAA